MALRNRVDPFGVLHAVASRGLLMGNRGGRLHDDAQQLGTRMWASRRWIICLCDFRGRKRAVWGKSYSELFFPDEVTALAAGHRPCFECRREQARHFANCAGNGQNADAIDRQLHAERLDGRNKRMHEMALPSLPDGTMFCEGGQAFAVRGAHVLPWSFAGYLPALMRHRGMVDVLTPPTSLTALANGFAPLWHSVPET